MQEVFEKIKVMLAEQYRKNRYESHNDEWNVGIDQSVQIVNEVAAEYNNGWIPCSERMPEETEKQDDIFDPITLATVDSRIYTASGLVLVTVRDYELNDDFTMDDMTVNGKWVNFESDGRYEVIAWQPLPAPYKPKED